MTLPRFTLRGLALPAIILLGASALYAADWPAYRHDAARSGVTAEKLPAHLHRQWVHRPKHPPQPAWPEPGKEMHRMPFDYAYQVAVGNGVVYFGSSADNKLHALALATGRERWSFVTGAPIRFAPQIVGDRVFVASDDGSVYCVSADEGKLVWRFRAAPRDDKLLGNERMISRWPPRSGVVVDDGVVYVTAGMWPSEGVYVYAVRAEDGSVIWRNDTSGAMYMKLPHNGAEAMTGVAPQGYLLASDDTLLVPTGRSVPAAFDRETGRFLYYRAAENKRNGGAWASVSGDLVFCGLHPGGPDIDVRLGEASPAKGDGLMAWDCRTGTSKLRLEGKHRVVVKGDTVYASGSGSVSAHSRNALNQVKWQTPCDRVYSLILAGDTLFAAGRGEVLAINSANGDVLWTSPVNGQARGLAVADGRLLVSATTGDITCFGSERIADPPVIKPEIDASPYPEDELTSAYAALAERIVKETGVTEGYCLDFGAGDGRLAYELAKRTDLKIHCVEPDVEKVAAARKALDAAGLYGVRVTVDQGSLSELPYASYFANLIVSGGAFAGTMSGGPSGAELYRALRPCGGVAYLSLRDTVVPRWRQVALTWLRNGGVLAEEISATKDAVMVVRGPLPGAGDWTHQYADAGKSGCASDQRVKWPMGLLWFGGPGPERMMSRHWKAAAPVSTNGRLFIAGQHHIIAVDAYNGRELWCAEIPSVAVRAANVKGSKIAADTDSVYLATGGVCFRLDAATGDQRMMYRLPLQRERYVLAGPQSFTLGPDRAPLGTVAIARTAAGLDLKLITKDTKVTNRHREDTPRVGDSWELFFDFRPAAQRGGLYGPGAFQAIVVPASIEQPSASWKAGAGPAHPRLDVTGTHSNAGSETTVRLAWDDIRALVGRRPSSFGFGVTLNSSDDGDTQTGKTHKFANADSSRLTTLWATFVVDAPSETEPEQPDLLPAELGESRIWGYLAVAGDLVYGTVGTDTDSEYVFARNKADGQLRWLYTAEESISHNAIAVGDGRVYVIDRTSAGKLDQLKRRGEPVVPKSTLVALGATTGQVLWESEEGLGGRGELWFGNGVLLASSRGAMTAYSPTDGRPLWASAARSQKFPTIIGDTIYAQPAAYDLRTGEPTSRTHPLTAEQTPWNFTRAYGCGFVSAAPTMLFFRSGTFGFYDLAGDSGIHNFGGIRPGCFVNMIAAGGLVLVPEGTSACTCSYNFQTSVALAPTSKNEDWSVFSQPAGSGIVRQLALNLGAPGDRRDSEGTMWLSFPRPDFRAALKVPLITEIPPEAGYYHHNADELVVRGTERPWLYASGCSGLRRLALSLVLEQPVVSLPCRTAPKIDGLLDDACWDGKAPLVLADSGQNRDPAAAAFLRSDADNLYVAFQRRAPSARGRAVPWTMNATGEDADVSKDDSWTLLLSDNSRRLYVQLGVSASGARFDGSFTYGKDKAVDKQWHGIWVSEVSARPDAWTAELAIPWETLAALGLNKDQLTVDVKGANRTGGGPETVALSSAGVAGFADVSFDQPPPAEPKRYTVRLHFAEADGVGAGERVFDVKIQDEVVLRDFDVVKEAGAMQVALVKEFEGIEATDTINIELAPKREAITAATAPMISALEVALQP